MFNIDIIQLFYDIDNFCQELKQKNVSETSVFHHFQPNKKSLITTDFINNYKASLFSLKLEMAGIEPAS
jgi:hypothetical protein